MTDTHWLWPDSIISRIVDGDSFYARLRRDIGFHGFTEFEVKLRLNRVNTPPAKTIPGRESTDMLEHLVRNGSGVPSPPMLIETLRSYKYGGGEYMDWMAEVTLPDGRNLSDAMVAAGVAQYWDGVGPRPGG